MLFRIIWCLVAATFHLLASLINTFMPVSWPKMADWLTELGKDADPVIERIAGSSAIHDVMSWFGLEDWQATLVALLKANPMGDKVGEALIFATLLFILITIVLLIRWPLRIWNRRRKTRRASEMLVE